MTQTAKVGFVVLLFAAMVIAAFATLGQSLWSEPRVRYQAIFADAGGATPGSTVLLSGVRVGSVEEVKLESAGRAVLVLGIRKGVAIPAGTEAVLTNSLVGFGDRPLELVPPSTPTAGVMSAENEIPGRIKGALEGIVPDTTETLAELNKTLKATQGLIGDQEMRGKLVDLLESSNKTITQFGSLAQRIDNVTAENQGTLRQTLVQASAMLADVSKATSAVARIASEGKFEKKTLQLLDELEKSVKEGQLLVADIRGSVNDPNLRKPMEQILANTQTMSESGTRIAGNAEVMTKNGIELSEKAIEIAEKASKLADELSEVLKKFDSALGKVAGITAGGASSFGPLTTEATMVRETDPGRFRAEFEATLPIGQDQYRLGLWDAFESNKLIAQIGQKLDDKTTLRYGVFASQPGIGVDYRVAPGVRLRGDLFDLNDPRLDVRTQVELNKDLKLLLGLDRVFQRTSPTFGISLKR